MKTLSTEGIVLKRYNIGEADKVVTLYSKHYGKISCIAKGVRRMISRKRGSLEIFSQVKIFASIGKGMMVITEVELVSSNTLLRSNLKKIAVAYQICELVDRLTPENHEQDDVFNLLVNSLDSLSKVEEKCLNSLLVDFSMELLKLLGYWPRDKCIPRSFSPSSFIEDIIERKLKSKKFMKSCLNNVEVEAKSIN